MDDSVSKIDQIKSNYTNSLLQKSVDIKTQLEKLNSSGWSDTDAAKSLKLMIHKLSGSAGSYGFDNLSEIAMDIDVSMKNRIAGDISEQVITEKLVLLLDAMDKIYRSAQNSSRLSS